MLENVFSHIFLINIDQIFHKKYFFTLQAKGLKNSGPSNFAVSGIRTRVAGRAAIYYELAKTETLKAIDMQIIFDRQLWAFIALQLFELGLWEEKIIW